MARDTKRRSCAGTIEAAFMYSGPDSAEIYNSGFDWSEKRYLKLSKERGKDSWLVHWRSTGTLFGRIWKEHLTWIDGKEHWQCERTLGTGCPDAYRSKQEALLSLKSLNLEAAKASERAARESNDSVSKADDC